MTKLTKLLNPSDSQVEVVFPISDEEINKRHEDYPVMDFVDFAKKYRGMMFKKVTLKLGGKEFQIQANFCVNPFCRWYGLPQHKYLNLKGSPSRYKLLGTHPRKSIGCNAVQIVEPEGITIQSYITPISNWSLAEEIKRLVDINKVVPMEVDYVFHKDICPEPTINPFDNPTLFYRRGKSSSNSQKYQCKTCGKITNVLPNIRECFTYYQQRNIILVEFMKLVVGRVPVTRALEILNIGSGTYYNKLEWLHRRCLEFLERHETEVLKKKHFGTLWLNTDKLVYNLNNIRKKGHGKDYSEQERPTFPTHIVATVDSISKYAFRTDIAFDYNVRAEAIEKDIELLKENKLYSFAQKNARYRYSYYGKSTKDELHDGDEDDIINKYNLQLRKDYVDGFHVNSSYTAYAQYWLIKDLLNVEKINFVCDDDNSLINAILRVFKDEVKSGTVNVFTCQVEKTLDKRTAFREYMKKVEELTQWQKALGLKSSKKDAAIMMMAEELSDNELYDYIAENGKEYPAHISARPIEHATPKQDEGIRYVDCLTNLSELTPYDLAKELYQVDSRAINTYFNQLRRRSSLLERPIVSSRGEGKSYIYANFNPKYMHYLLTIMRTYLNFCDTFKDNKKDVTPAMKLGIADKPFTMEDIIYFR